MHKGNKRITFAAARCEGEVKDKKEEEKKEE